MDKFKQFKMRISASDHKALMAAAKKSKRTANAELVARLHASLEAENLEIIVQRAVERAMAPKNTYSGLNYAAALDAHNQHLSRQNLGTSLLAGHSGNLWQGG